MMTTDAIINTTNAPPNPSNHRSVVTLFSTLETTKTETNDSSSPTTLSDEDILLELERAAEEIASDSIDKECIVDPETGGPMDELCVNEGMYARVKGRFKSIVRGTLSLVRSDNAAMMEEDASLMTDSSSVTNNYLFGSGVFDGELVPEGELLERGWETWGHSSAL